MRYGPHIARLVCFALALLLVRLVLTGQFSFFFLCWNLFLAWLPVFFLEKYVSTRSAPLKTAFAAGAILFLPNAPYIVTDLFHLKKDLVAPIWFDTMLILTFAILGLFCFVSAAKVLVAEIHRNFQPRIVSLGIKVSLWLATGYGVYLGRYVRLNSWDALFFPSNVAHSLLRTVLNPFSRVESVALTICYAVFLSLIFNLYESATEAAKKSPQLPQSPR